MFFANCWQAVPKLLLHLIFQAIKNLWIVTIFLPWRGLWTPLA